MLINKFFSLISLTLILSAGAVFGTVDASAQQAPDACTSNCIRPDYRNNITVSKYSDLAIRFPNTMRMPSYTPGYQELEESRKSSAESRTNNALYTFLDPNNDHILRVSYVATDYKMGDKIDDIKPVRSTRQNAYLRYFLTPEAIRELNTRTFVYNIPAAKQPEYKVDTLIRFQARNGRIYSIAFNRSPKSPTYYLKNKGIKIWFNSKQPATENLNRQFKDGKVIFYQK